VEILVPTVLKQINQIADLKIILQNVISVEDMEGELQNKRPPCRLAEGRRPIGNSYFPIVANLPFIRGKCHLLMLITTHNGQEVSLSTRPQLERGEGG